MSPTAISDSGMLCPEIVETVLQFFWIAPGMQENDLVDSTGLVQLIAKAASSPEVTAAVFVYCSSFLDHRRAGKNSRVSPVLYHTLVLEPSVSQSE